jgi:hypothetical protein
MLDATTMFISNGELYVRADFLGRHACRRGRLGASSKAHSKGLSPRLERKRTR